jgi:uncharacterized protein YkwD
MKKLLLAALLVTHLCLAATPESILTEINRYRHEQGLSALQMNSSISLEAKHHSMDMAEHKTPFGHQGFNSRVSRLFTTIKRSDGAAENVAYLPGNNANNVVKLWLHSSGHRRNIEGHYNLTGIGMAYDQHGTVYVTQIFLRTGVKHRATNARYQMHPGQVLSELVQLPRKLIRIF